MPHTQIRAILATTALGLLLTGCAAAPQFSPAEQEMSETMGKDSFQPATRALRDSIETQELLAQAAFWMREYELNPADLEAAIKLAAAVRKVGNPKRAVEITQTTRALYPRDPYLTAEYAAALIASERAGDAIDPLDEALAYAPAYGRLWSLKGAALDQLEQYDLARKHYAQALKITPNDPSVMANLGLSHALSGDPQTAERWLRRAASIPGASKSVHQNLSLVLQIQGKIDEADKVARVAATKTSGRLPDLNPKPAHSLRGAVPASQPQSSHTGQMPSAPTYSGFRSTPPQITTSNSPSVATRQEAGTAIRSTAPRSSTTKASLRPRTYPSQSTQSASSYSAQRTGSSTPPLSGSIARPQSQARIYQGAQSASEAARMAAQSSSRRSQLQTVTPEQKKAQEDILAKLASNVGARPANPALAQQMQQRYAQQRQQQAMRQQAIRQQGLQRESVMSRQARMAPPSGLQGQQRQQQRPPSSYQQPAYAQQSGYAPYQRPVATAPGMAPTMAAPNAAPMMGQNQATSQSQGYPAQTYPQQSQQTGQAYPPQGYAPGYQPQPMQTYGQIQSQAQNQSPQLRGAARQRR